MHSVISVEILVTEVGVKELRLGGIVVGEMFGAWEREQIEVWDEV